MWLPLKIDSASTNVSVLTKKRDTERKMVDTFSKSVVVPPVYTEIELFSKPERETICTFEFDFHSSSIA